MPPRSRKQARNKRLVRYLKMAGDAGTLAMSLRDKPKALDWLGVGLRAVSLALTVKDERRRAESRDPWKYFTDVRNDEWTEVPEEFRRLVMEAVTETEVDERYWDGDEHSPFLSRGKIDGELVAWIGEGTMISDGPYVLTSRLADTYRRLGERMWRRIGGANALYGTTGLATDPLAGNTVIATAQMTALCTRVRGFRDAGEPRAYLLAGPPGTGKSMAIRWLVAELGLTSLRIDLAVLAKLHGYANVALATSLETLLYLLRPQVMILDDLDRISVTAPLLAFLELAQRTCQVVIGSVNSVEKLMGAALRPGRFDEIIKIERLDPDVLRRLLGDDVDLFDRLAELPAAYVVEFVKRRRVLGRAVALVELDELLHRAGKIASAPDSE